MASEDHHADTANLQVRDAHGRLQAVLVAACIGAPFPGLSS